MPSAQRSGSRSKKQQKLQQQQDASDDDLAPGATVETISASQLDNLSIEPVDNQDQLPCSISGFFPALSGGAIGFVFGAGGAAFGRLMNRKTAAAAQASGNHVGFFKHTWQEGAKSAKTFAIMSGVYSTASCLAKRLRQQDDAFNGAIAGCATGLALGWSGGPASAAQSCAMIGIFSYIVDRLGAAEAQASHMRVQQLQQASRRTHGSTRGDKPGQGGVVVGSKSRTRTGSDGTTRGGCAGSSSGSIDGAAVAGNGAARQARRGAAGGESMQRGVAEWEAEDMLDVGALLQQSMAAFLTPAARWMRPCHVDEGACWLGPRRQRQ